LLLLKNIHKYQYQRKRILYCNNSCYGWCLEQQAFILSTSLLLQIQ